MRPFRRLRWLVAVVVVLAVVGLLNRPAGPAVLGHAAAIANYKRQVRVYERLQAARGPVESVRLSNSERTAACRWVNCGKT